MKKTIWVDKNFLEYDSFMQSSELVDPADWQQQYDIYNHAESILDKNPTEHDLACTIFQLNRAIDFREKLLNEHYSFKKIPGLQGKKHHEAMHSLGLIKPLLKTKLDTIRNKVMHSAKYPVPKLQDVAELTEFTWYFLRSTDLIASRKADSLVFNKSPHDDKDEWTELSFSLNNWRIEIRGKYFNHNISNTHTAHSVEVELEKITSEENITYTAGVVLGPKDIENEMVRKYFIAL